ncbi:MAG: carbohydrate kinase [Oscillospiraceae bacterium]|jgi:fructokinase|nr:carbohydrate kinase [Oscillospiraceae bacterium]
MDITALGELLIDFTDVGESSAGMKLFERNPGGAPANVAVGAARVGLRSAFIGKVGADVHGQFLRETLERERVDCRNLLTDPDAFTTLAFVQLGAHGEREFSFSRNRSADVMLRERELDLELIAGSSVLHVGTLSATSEPSRSATLAAAKHAKSHGVTVSLDVNYRASLWQSADDFRAAVALLLPYVTLLKVSDEEAELMGDALTYAAPLTVVTRGASGADIYREGTHTTRVEAVAAPDVVDTTGAGDAFWVGVLYEFLTNGGKLDGLTGTLAAKSASLCVRKRGAIPALPTIDEILAL